MKKFEFTVEENEEGIRLDKFLSLKLNEVTRSKIQEIIAEKLVLNQLGQALKSSQKTKVKDQIFITIPDVKPMNVEAKQIDFEIIYEDDDLLVINKPAGLTVHPGAGNQSHTLVNALLFTHQNKLSSGSEAFRPGIVHRLDKNTSGLMIVAKNDFTHQALSEKLKNHEIERNYLTFIYGKITPGKGTINKNINRSRFNRLKMATSRNLGREAITTYATREVFCQGYVSLLECKLQTGRTHQIRLHMESEKHSLIGDQTYNGCRKTAPKDIDPDLKDLIANFKRQALHSYKIKFSHPRTNKEIFFEIPFPDDLENLHQCLKKIVVISGPTACGKSNLALELGSFKDIAVINADSLQIYQGLPILSAQPSFEEQKQVEHLLYSHLLANQNCSVGLWLKLVKETVTKVEKAGKLPVIVGGTGMYISRLIEGINKIPEISPEKRKEAENLYQELGHEAFVEKFGGGKIIDKQRLIRACEVFLQSGITIFDWQKKPKEKIFEKAEFIHLNLDIPRQKLYQNCNLRFEQMLSNGALEEVELLLKLPVEENWQITKTLGFAEISSFIEGEITREKMLEIASQKTRNYAKRQMTWFRNQLPNKNNFDNAAKALEFLREKIS